MASLSLVFDIFARDRASQAFNNVGNAAQGAGQAGTALGGAMKAAGAAIASAGLATVLGDAVTAASDLSETVNKSNVIFGDNAAAVQKWSQGAARNFGLSQQAALAAATGFGDMLQQLGFTADAALEASTGTVKLAADLGSFNNLDTEDVLDRIGAAMRGEYDSLQALIPNINAARVEHEAMAATGKTTAAALTAQEKAAATLAIVTKDGAAAQNDFAETSDGLANSQKILNAEWEDAQARMGALLIGPVTGLVQALTNGLIPAFEGATEILGSVIGFMADNIPLALGLATALGVYLAGGIAAVSTAFGTWIAAPILTFLASVLAGVSTLAGVLAGGFTATLGAASAAVAGFIAAIAPLAAIGGVVVAITSLISASNEVDDRLQAAAEAGEDLGAVLADQDGQLNSTTREAALLAAETSGLSDVFEDAGVNANTLTDALLGSEQSFEQLRRAAEEADKQATLSAAEWGTLGILHDVNSGKITQNVDALLALRDATEKSREEAEATTDVIPLFGASLEQLGQQATESAVATQEAAEDSEEAIQKWLDKLGGINDSFVEILPTYKDLLGQAEESIRHYAEVAAEKTTDASDSWEDYVYEAEVSLTELSAALQKQLDDQANWRDNLAQIAQWAGADVAQHLAQMGADGVAIVAAMADGTTAGAQDMREQILREIQQGGEQWTASMDEYMNIMDAIGRQGGQATVASIAAELGIGVGRVRDIARQYGVELAAGINPLLGALGKPGVDISGAINSGGGRAMGGPIYGPGGPTDDRAGLFALSDGEYVVRAASVAKYGVGFFDDLNFGRLATGGYVSASAVPQPPSTAPYRPPISTAGDATMDRAYDSTVAWLEENLAPPAASLAGPGNYAAMFAAVQRVFPYVQLHSGYRPGSITATGNLSYHASGRAIDITPDAAIFNWIYDNYFSPTRELIYSPMGSRQIWNGQHHYYSEPTRGDHWDHIHWAMANGGVIREPVVGMGLRTGASYSFGERGPETVVPWDMSGGRGGGGPIVVKIDGATVTGQFVMDPSGVVRLVNGQLTEAGRTQSRHARSYQ